ncbi:MAG: hypothetical protein V2I97_05385 [Desulfococcaceae bacterium]|jgi:hypothetical protein|nr:hypothetical protein [Desulfococcaceae bacterium]
MDNKVDVLQKVTLTADAGTDEKTSGSYEFIFGIGSRGLTPFEYDLVNKKCGDTVRISLGKEIIPEYFGHIVPPFRLFPESGDIVQLHMKIQKIEKALPAELVRAMAQQVEGCSCGCGGHGHDSASCDPSRCDTHGHSHCACSH